MNNAVPEGWVIATLNEFASVKGGKRLPKGKTFSSAQTKYPYVRVTILNRVLWTQVDCDM
jgi:type I restriction enzyme S subunit